MHLETENTCLRLTIFMVLINLRPFGNLLCIQHAEVVRYLCGRDASTGQRGTNSEEKLGSHNGDFPIRDKGEDDDNETARSNLLAIGYQVGQQLAEVYSRDKERFVEQLDCIKFVCKDLWYKLFKKPIDNLKTNHRGVFVLLDNNFRWTSKIDGNISVSNLSSLVVNTMGDKKKGSQSESSTKLDDEMTDADRTTINIPPSMFAALACGILQGSLYALGVQCVVNADLQRLPACTFTLRISGV